MNEVTSTAQKEAWVAPEIRTLDVGETATGLNTGGDGGTNSDNTKS